MKDKRNYHGAVGKLFSEQHFHKSAAITFIVRNFWSPTPSATSRQAGGRADGQAGRQAGRQANKVQVNFKIFQVGCRLKYLTCRFILPRYNIIKALPMHSSG